MWISSGRLTNPTANQVLVDTGVLSAGWQSITAAGADSVAALFELQHRNAANDTTLKSQILAVPASGTDRLPEFIFPVSDGERIRIILVAGITGSASVSLQYTG